MAEVCRVCRHRDAEADGFCIVCSAFRQVQALVQGEPYHQQLPVRDLLLVGVVDTLWALSRQQEGRVTATAAAGAAAPSRQRAKAAKAVAKQKIVEDPTEHRMPTSPKWHLQPQSPDVKVGRTGDPPLCPALHDLGPSAGRSLGSRDPTAGSAGSPDEKQEKRRDKGKTCWFLSVPSFSLSPFFFWWLCSI